MASKYPTGGYQQPPPYQGAPPPYQYPQAGPSVIIQQYGQYPPTPNTTVIVQQQHRPPPTNHGLLGSLGKDLNRLGGFIQKELDAAGNMIRTEYHQHNYGPVLENFVTGNQIQLVSKSSGRALQIVQSSSGQLVVDGMGVIGPEVFNAVWTVINEGNNQVRLHNNFNYLAIVNGHTVVMHVPQGSHLGIETKFMLLLKGQNFVCLESCKERGKCVGILGDGTLKPAAACSANDDHAKFGVYFASTPFSKYPKQK
ncbi:uncharacterized protein LOC133197335 isoform X1 [Saccostrea echinata]|uniref:uncharacterized protein LOC133197335 isoform X1 n=1 Tax=Saccostrea echinata TaxID=191078 RepID=UPI002A81A52D|nr:uncharacterized protein LOC133197335 isoform X1 [Saccostrea echinata]